MMRGELLAGPIVQTILEWRKEFTIFSFSDYAKRVQRNSSWRNRTRMAYEIFE